MAAGRAHPARCTGQPAGLRVVWAGGKQTKGTRQMGEVRDGAAAAHCWLGSLPVPRNADPLFAAPLGWDLCLIPSDRFISFHTLQ